MRKGEGEKERKDMRAYTHTHTHTHTHGGGGICSGRQQWKPIIFKLSIMNASYTYCVSSELLSIFCQLYQQSLNTGKTEYLGYSLRSSYF